MIETIALPETLMRGESAAYYALPDAQTRRNALNACASDDDGSDGMLRRKWLQSRFFSLDASGQVDAFMHAWIMLLSASSNPPSPFFLKKRSRELHECMEEFGLAAYPSLPPNEQTVLREEWADFARLLIRVSLDSKSYRSTLFGALPMKSNDVEQKIALDIVRALRLYPARLGEEQAFLPLFEIMQAVCVFLLPDTGDLFA